MVDLVARVRARLRRLLEARVRAALADRAADHAAIAADLAAVRVALPALERRLADARARLDPTPLGPYTTVHAAHARHPGVRALFAARGLPACPDCAVGADETLAEAAFGEGFDLQGLLDAIAALDAEDRSPSAVPEAI